MTLYEFLLMLHVIAAIIWLGAGFLFLVLITLAHRANEAEREASYHADIDRLAPILFIPASLATFVLGLLTALEGDWDFGQAWILIGLGGWLFSFLVGIAYFKPESARIMELNEQGPDGQAEAMSRSSRMTAVDHFQLTTLFVVVAAMVLKPTGDDPGVLIALAAALGLVALANARALRGDAGAPSAPTTP
jgi:uncharacterized membrane protein